MLALVAGIRENFIIRTNGQIPVLPGPSLSTSVLSHASATPAIAMIPQSEQSADIAIPSPTGTSSRSTHSTSASTRHRAKHTKPSAKQSKLKSKSKSNAKSKAKAKSKSRYKLESDSSPTMDEVDELIWDDGLDNKDEDSLQNGGVRKKHLKKSYWS